MSRLPQTIPFIDLRAQRHRLGDGIDRRIAEVIAEGRYILGPQVGELEESLAARVGVAHTITCGNGTDALVLGLMALDTGPGDAVFVPAFTFAATAEAVALVGATPVFVDVRDDNYNLDSASLEAAVGAITASGSLRPRGILTVDLFGQPADYPQITRIAETHGLWIVEDAAQAFGATLANRRCGSFGMLGTTSFFPAKPLGCYGDGGAIFTSDDALAARLRSLRVHGRGKDKYDNVAIGMNSRLDTIQAAVLLAKLTIFDDELAQRSTVAREYDTRLHDVAETPTLGPQARSAWAQYTIQTNYRPAIQTELHQHAVPTGIYYARALPDQPAYRKYPTAPGGVPVARSLAKRVLSLPMHPYLDTVTQDRIANLIGQAVREVSA